VRRAAWGSPVGSKTEQTGLWSSSPKARGQIKELIGWANRGPGAARVDSVDVRWRSFTGDYADFRITE
jgi:acylphosphatase